MIAVSRYHLLLAAIAIVALVAPFYVYPVLLMKVLCFAIFAHSLNLIMGYGGMVSFGHAMFFGMGSYMSGYAMKAWGWTPEFGILLAVATTALMGVAVGLIAIRRQGIYLAMISLAFAQMVYFICVQAPFTGGEDGIQNVPRRPLFGLIDISSNLTLYFVVLAGFVLVVLAIRRIVTSPFGRVLQAIRENDQRVTSLGYSTLTYKLMAFVISAALAGLAGGVKALVFQVASLTDVAWQMSGEVILMTLLGGIGTITGPLVGAAVIVGLQNYLSTLGEWIMVLQGLIFIAAVLLFREGIVGTARRMLRSWQKAR